MFEVIKMATTGDENKRFVTLFTVVIYLYATVK